MEAQARAETIAAEQNLVWVHPYDDPHIIAGQGTIALEMLDEEPDLDVLIVPIGGGGLIAGNAIAARAQKAVDRDRRRRNARSIRRCGMRSMSGNRPCGGATLAEGIAVSKAGGLTLPIVRELVSDIVLVEEVLIERAVNAFLTLQKTMAEGAGAAGLAAMLAEPERFAGRKVGLILCGGNIDPRILASIVVRELERENRIVSFRLTIPDRPGVFGQITSRLGELGANILGVEHHRLVSRRAGQGRQARRHHGDARRRACRGDFPRARGRRLSAGADGRRYRARLSEELTCSAAVVIGRREDVSTGDRRRLRSSGRTRARQRHALRALGRLPAWRRSASVISVMVAILATTLGRCGGSGILPRSAVPAGRSSASSTTVACSADATVSFGGELGLNAVGEGHAMAGAEEDAGAATAGATAGAGAAGCASLAAAMLAARQGTWRRRYGGRHLTRAGAGIGVCRGKGRRRHGCDLRRSRRRWRSGRQSGCISGRGHSSADSSAHGGSLGFLISIKAARASVAVVVLAVWMAT